MAAATRPVIQARQFIQGPLLTLGVSVVSVYLLRGKLVSYDLCHFWKVPGSVVQYLEIGYRTHFAWPRADRDPNPPRTNDKDFQYFPYVLSRRMALQWFGSGVSRRVEQPRVEKQSVDNVTYRRDLSIE